MSMIKLWRNSVVKCSQEAPILGYSHCGILFQGCAHLFSPLNRGRFLASAPHLIRVINTGIHRTQANRQECVKDYKKAVNKMQKLLAFGVSQAHTVKSTDYSVEAKVKGFIGFEEGYMVRAPDSREPRSRTLPGNRVATAAGTLKPTPICVFPTPWVAGIS